VIADLSDLRRSDVKEKRAQFRQDAYAIMLLNRHIDKGMEGSSAYMLLAYYLNTHFSVFGTGSQLTDANAYINAIATGNVMGLINGYLSYRPTVVHNAREVYDKISHSLIFA
jgi:hypothetical protein